MDGMTITAPQDAAPQPIAGSANADRRLSVLLSAYACEPDKGSEPGIGWQWAVNLAALGHRVWVITRANNRDAIERALEASSIDNIRFLYFDLPSWARTWKRGGRGVHIYYLLWQLGAYRVARDLVRTESIDVVHHITFGVYRHPSFMAFLGIPFVFGPVGGGERTPWALRKGFPLRGHVADALRDMANLAVRFDPLLRAMFRRTALTLCKTRETLGRVPGRYRQNCRVQLELGMDREALAPAPHARQQDETFHVLYVGRLLYLKGLHLALEAFANAFCGSPWARFTIIGSGKDEQWLKSLARRLGVAAQVEWIPWMPREQLLNQYGEHDVLLFPSLHDSSGNVVLEAMTMGLPVVCVDLGGPGEMVHADFGIAVAPGPPRKVVAALSEGLQELAQDPTRREIMAQNARVHAETGFCWRRQAKRMTTLYEQVIAAGRKTETEDEHGSS